MQPPAVHGSPGGGGGGGEERRRIGDHLEGMLYTSKMDYCLHVKNVLYFTSCVWSKVYIDNSQFMQCMNSMKVAGR